MLLLLLVLAGFALRLPLLHRFPLREDEAIYGYWALHAWYVDSLFLHVWPDKPPFFLWLLSLAFQLWGHAPDTAPAAARMVSILAGTLAIPVLAVTARRWWGERAALVTALLVTLNPFAISFAPTAYTDSVLVLAGSLSLALAAHGRWFWSGLWLGAAIMTKQQGLLFVPLLLAAAVQGKRTNAPEPRQGAPLPDRAIGRSLLALAGGLALVVAPILYWDSLRWAVAPSPWDLGAANVGGVGMLPPTEWPGRSAAWGRLAWHLLSSPLYWGAYAALLIGALTLALRRRKAPQGWRAAAVLAAWSFGFLILHVASSVQIWDRYLLPLVIPLALLGGWGASALLAEGQASAPSSKTPKAPLYAASAKQRWVPAAALGVALLLAAAAPALHAAGGGLPAGGDHGDYSGLDEALAAVDVPGALLFHRELGWQARFALFDSLRSGEVELRYYPSSVYLADSAAKSAHKQRYVIVPDWSPLRDLPLQLAVRGLRAEAALNAGHFTVYRIDEAPAVDAAWRLCAPARRGPFTLLPQPSR
jgi:4-amino-4-deoxy-L-arabinose transferase-like glycosyltransferase